MPILAADWSMIGSLADWTTTAVAIAAGAVAYGAFRKTSDTNDAQQETLKLQQKQFAVAEDRDKRTQASKVMFAADDENNSDLRVEVFNASETPVYSLLFLARAIEPGERVVIAYLRILRPTGLDKVELAFPGPPYEFPPDLVEMVFVDSDGRPWVRDWRGTLGELNEAMQQHVNIALRGAEVVSGQNKRIARDVRRTVPGYDGYSHRG